MAQRVDAYRWEALAESRALLTILSPSGLTSSMELEIGAARAWNKPIYGVVTDPSSTRVPPAFTRVDLYTAGRVQEIIRGGATLVGTSEASETGQVG